MAIQNLPLNAEASVRFLEKHSLAIRLWHWLFFITISATLVTVLLASTVFRTRNNTSLVQEQLQAKGVIVTSDQARAVSHEFNDKLWHLHTWAGYIICGLLISRVLIELFQPGDEKLHIKIKRMLGVQPGNTEDRLEKKHYLQVKAGYVVFYILLLMMALTGLALAFEEVPFFDSIHEQVKAIHSFGQYLVYGYILLHLGGVIRADLGKHRGIVSGMIHGKKV